MKVRYIGEDDPLGLRNNKVYEVIAVEKELYRIVDETNEDYLFFPEMFEIIEE